MHIPQAAAHILDQAAQTFMTLFGTRPPRKQMLEFSIHLLALHYSAHNSIPKLPEWIAQVPQLHPINCAINAPTKLKFDYLTQTTQLPPNLLIITAAAFTALTLAQLHQSITSP